MDQHEQYDEYDEYDERPFDLSGGGFFKIIRNLWYRKTKKFYDKLIKETNELKNLKAELISKLEQYDAVIKSLAFSAISIVNLILTSSSSSTSPNDSIHKLRETFFAECEKANKLLSEIRESERHFNILHKAASHTDELLSKLKDKKIHAEKAKREKRNQILPNSKYGDLLGSNIEFATLDTASAEATINAKESELEKLKTDLDNTIKKILFTVSVFSESNEINKETNKSDTFSKISVLLSSSDNMAFELYCKADNVNLLMKYYFYKNDGHLGSIIDFETGKNSIIFKDIPILLQYFFHELSKEANSICANTNNFFSDSRLLDEVVKLKKNLNVTLFNPMIPTVKIKLDDIKSIIPYTLLFYTSLFGRNVISINVLLGEMVSMSMNLVNTNIDKSANIDDVSADISIILERFILIRQYQQLLNMLWSAHLSTGFFISSNYLRIVTYKMLNTNDMPLFLNMKTSDFNENPMKDNEAKRIKEELNLLNRLDLQSTDVFMLTGGSNDSIGKIKNSFSGNYEEQTQGYHLNLFKKSEKKDNIVSKIIIKNQNYIITEAILNGQKYVFVNLYLPFMKISNQARNNNEARNKQLSEILKELGSYDSIKSANPIIIFASLNYNNFMKTIGDQVKESVKGGISHKYLDFGAGGFQILELPQSIYYFDYNIIETVGADKITAAEYFLSNVFSEGEGEGEGGRLHNLDYIFYKFPATMNGYKINITTPIKKTIDIIIEEDLEKPKIEAEKAEKEEKEKPADTSGEYIEVSGSSSVTTEIATSEVTTTKEESSSTTKFTSPYILQKKGADIKIVTDDDITGYKTLLESVISTETQIKEANAKLKEAEANLKKKQHELTTLQGTVDKTITSLIPKIKDISEEISRADGTSTGTRTFSVISSPSDDDVKDVINNIVDLFDSNTVKFEKEQETAGVKNPYYLKINNIIINNKYKIKLKSTYKDNSLNNPTFHTLHENNEKIGSLKADIGNDAKDDSLSKEVTETTKLLAVYDAEVKKNKEEFNKKLNEINESKLKAVDWKYAEKQPSNHQLFAFEIVKKDAPVSAFDKEVVPAVKAELEKYKIKSEDFNIHGRTTVYNQYIYLLELFNKTLGISREGGINYESFIRSVINLFYYRDKKVYKEEDFKVSSASKEIVVGGGNPKQLSHKRNIIISVMNPKSIDYSALKLKNRTNKKKLGCVRKRSRCKYSKHKRHSKRIA